MCLRQFHNGIVRFNVVVYDVGDVFVICTDNRTCLGDAEWANFNMARPQTGTREAQLTEIFVV